MNEESDKTETESEAIMADVIIKSLINVDNVDEKINEQQDQVSFKFQQHKSNSN